MMKLLAALFLLAGPAHAATRLYYESAELKQGHYSAKLTGMLCGACVRVILNELKGLPEIDSPKIDFEREEITFTVKPKKMIRLSSLRRALKYASKRINLGTSFELDLVRYIP